MESTLSDGKFRLFVLGIPSKDKRFIQPDASEKRMLGRRTEENSFRTDFPFRCALQLYQQPSRQPPALSKGASDRYALVHPKGIGQSELDNSLPHTVSRRMKAAPPPHGAAFNRQQSRFRVHRYRWTGI